jgi:hypothetical protein
VRVRSQPYVNFKCTIYAGGLISKSFCDEKKKTFVGADTVHIGPRTFLDNPQGGNEGPSSPRALFWLEEKRKVPRREKHFPHWERRKLPRKKKGRTRYNRDNATSAVAQRAETEKKADKEHAGMKDVSRTRRGMKTSFSRKYSSLALSKLHRS